ncbi:virulence-associated protein [Corynebacterium kutscheri]|uniref:Addiction module antidote protein, HigA family n=1 Tax=Corynebacterium kutscheri TaxID=35755 RepID=A0A0F6QZH7_9CORY|nr:HigA family addiction module antitoxin [Corynebacterium kutscheri]AKE40725.1 addiction module antidote protein, HigA family [Corynebacterium kutscheri]VEH04628.1 virulence-associated protein [Corynebacterium kutscheri]VEH11122.1 virulence-associated protein [Corynebacterium kutscheri]VEH80401.1 virulence-associated protein [Corynebacterium kutscheri]
MTTALPHPGILIRREILTPLGMDSSRAAKWLQLDKTELDELLNGDCPISAQVARHLERAGISNAQAWLAVQNCYNEAHP